MPPTIQLKSKVVTAKLSHDRSCIEVSAGSISGEEARDLAHRLHQLAAICNVAIFQPSHVFSLWDSTRAPEAFTVEVDLAVLGDLQRVAKIGDSLEKSVIELINFYEDKSILNIILLPDALQGRESYVYYTAQFAHTLSSAQSHHPFIKVAFDKATGRLGIFCRTNKFTSQSFAKQLSLSLHKHRNVYIYDRDIPKTYHTNFPMLKQHLKFDFPNLSIVRCPEGINITITENKV